MDLFSDSDTSLQVTELPKYFQEFAGLNRSGILRKGRWSIKSFIETENDGDDEEEKDGEVEADLPICKFFDRWVEGRKLKKRREPRESEQSNQGDNRCKWLHSWTIRVLSRKEGSAVLMGQRASSANPRDIVGAVYIAGRVQEVVNSHEIKTTKGDFTLVGSITDEKKEIPSSVVKHFKDGFPLNWNEIISRHWVSNSASASSSDESIVVNTVGKRKKQVKSKQPSNALSLNKKKSKLGTKIGDQSPQIICKEISLSHWTLHRDPVEGFTLSGIVESSSNNAEIRVQQAGRILSRIGPKTVKTELGVFKLNGGISDRDKCLPELIKSKFAASFHCQWKRLLNSCLDKFPTGDKNRDSSNERNSLGSSFADESTAFDAKESQSTKDPSSRKRKFCEEPPTNKMEKRETGTLDNSLDESISISERDKENKEEESTTLNPSKKRAKKNTVKNPKGNTKEKRKSQKKSEKPLKDKVKPIEKEKTVKTVKKRQSVAAIEKPVAKKSVKGKAKPTNTKKKKKKDEKNKKNKDTDDDDCEFNINLEDALTNKNGNASLFSSFISDGVFGSASFKDFSLGGCLLSAKKSRSREGAETPPPTNMEWFDLLKNTTSNSIHSANSSIVSHANSKVKQEINKRVKKLNKASPKQSKKSKSKNPVKVTTKRNKDVDDLLQQMTSSRKGMSTPVLVRKMFRPRTPNSDNDSWDSDY
ncbi:uncharacterized protein LOC111046810 isoform X2 [Nilaparvata lugens]|uniref:uncharacterized protein LOC111046810 isoform X1 n=1 Tax=Nilaparvata lugens TaxID=108931 RepID=UPI00193E2BB1|nr:uncharacterized protein LOC111046810 isoform X1 [Nilaparvata lugens]XP_039283113.1 uncharacterized protein LOC111046810 isoform X2 [Nilaparvata lugens]